MEKEKVIIDNPAEILANSITDTHTNVENPLKRILINNFLGGIAWALGISLGASMVLAVLGFLFSKIGLVPIIGNFVIQVNHFIAANSQAFTK